MVSQEQANKNNEIEKSVEDNTDYWEKVEEAEKILDGEGWKEQIQFAFESRLKGKVKAEELPNNEDLRDKPEEVQDARDVLGRYLE